MATPTKTRRHSRSKSIETLNCENSNPNVSSFSPSLKSKKTPSKSTETMNSENANPNIAFSSPPPSVKSKKTPCSKSVPAKKSASKVVEFPVPRPGRKFIVTKKTLKKKDGALDFEKCRAEAYEALRASQEEFFRKPAVTVEACNEEKNGSSEQLETQIGSLNESGVRSENEICEADRKKDCTEKSEVMGEPEIEIGIENLEGSSEVRKMRSITMNKAINTMPDSGSGRVKHLVQAFESLQLIKKEEESEDKSEQEEQEERKQKVINWALPGLQPIAKTNNGSGPVSLSSSAEFISFAGLERDSPKGDYSSLDSNCNRSSWESRTTGGGRRSRRNSSDSLRSWNAKLKVTSQNPFKLRTEQRGRKKEEQFIKKVEEMLIEEQKMRIPVAQGLPWTTDEPECLVKPPVKERTEPLDVLLHTDVRAVERAGFDNFVSERLKYAEELRLERERQRKVEEEEEIKRLRKELVPKAQPMPYFDRPFVPKKSAKLITVPKEPNFLARPMKSSCD